MSGYTYPRFEATSRIINADSAVARLGVSDKTSQVKMRTPVNMMKPDEFKVISRIG